MTTPDSTPNKINVYAIDVKETGETFYVCEGHLQGREGLLVEAGERLDKVAKNIAFMVRNNHSTGISTTSVPKGRELTEEEQRVFNQYFKMFSR